MLCPLWSGFASKLWTLPKPTRRTFLGSPNRSRVTPVTHALCTILYPWAKDVDSFALETRNMHKQNTQFGVQWVLSSEDTWSRLYDSLCHAMSGRQSSRHIQDLEEKVSDKVQEETTILPLTIWGLVLRTNFKDFNSMLFGYTENVWRRPSECKRSVQSSMARLRKWKWQGNQVSKVKQAMIAADGS